MPYKGASPAIIDLAAGRINLVSAALAAQISFVRDGKIKGIATTGLRRARLTPKPWRLGIRDEPPRWPWVNAAVEQQWASWLAAYRAASASRATCELVRTVGTAEIHPDLRDLVALHDEACKVGSGLPLA